MLFQTLDNKQECVGLYYNNDLHFDEEEMPQTLSRTWKYVPYLRDYEGIEYANLYVAEKDVKELLPEFLLEDWEDILEKLGAFKRSLEISKINLRDNCFYDLVPTRFLVEYCEVKNKITEYVLDHVERPPRYDFSLKVHQMLEEISGRKINVNHKRARSYAKTSGAQLSRPLAAPPYVKYKQFGTRTGRLTTDANSFPILTLKKDFRTIVEPTNDFFVEMDFNGAEARTMMGLLGMDQPSDDIHLFHQQHVFADGRSRSQAKTAFFAWLYGSKAAAKSPEGESLAQYYRKEEILRQYWNGHKVITPLGKVINDVDQHHALNYIIQSTTAELTLLQALKVEHLLRHRGSGSYLAFVIHDALVLDMSQADAHLLPALKRLMESTKFGNFMVNTSKGFNLGTLREEIF